MPNRVIKESICVSEDIDRLSWFEEVVFYRLLVNCDDYGRYDGRPAVIKGKLFPLKEERLKTRELVAALNKLAQIGLIAFYEHDGGKFLYVTKWRNHQTPRANKSKYPEPSKSNCMQMHADDCNGNQPNADVADNRYSINDIRYTRERTRATRPTVEEVAEYCAERKNGIDARHFVDYYSQQGWKLSNGNPMKDWRAAVRNWERREKPKAEPKRYGADAATIRASFEMLKREQEEGA